MFTHPEQFAQAAKSLIEAQLSSFSAYTQAALDSGASVVDLNMDAVRTSLAATTVAAQQWLSAQPQELPGLTASQSQQARDRIQAYGRQAAGLVGAAQQRFSQAATAAPLNSFLKSAFAAGTARNTSLE